MTHPSLGIGSPQQVPSPDPTPSRWQSISETLGHVFKKMTSFPTFLVHLVARIRTVVTEWLFQTPPSNAQPKQNPPQLSQLPSSSAAKEVFIQTLGNKEEVFEEDVEQDLEPQLVHSQPSSLTPTPQSSPQPTKVSPVQPEINAARIETSNATTQPAPHAIDVPDDGNCLLYAIGVGLRTKYADYPEYQNKLNWNISTEQLEEVFTTSKLTEEGDPSSKLEREQAKKHLVKLLEVPGKQLRQQAADYLKQHLTDDDVLLALFDGVRSHIDITKKKLDEERSMTLLLEEQEDFDNLALAMQSIEQQEANMLQEDDLESYIKMTENDHVYCGIPQLFALCKFYDIPIRVLYKYGKADQYAETYNEQVNEGRESRLPTLTVAHVNDNHFKFIKD